MEIRIDTDDEIWGVIIIALLVVCGLIIIAGAVASYQRRSKNEACPELRMHATVVDKPSIPVNTIYALVWVTFQVEDGRRVRLNMPYQKAPLLGDSGMLTWQGDAMRSFVRDGDPGTRQSYTDYGTGAQNRPVPPPSGNIPTWKRIEMERAAEKEKDT